MKLSSNDNLTQLAVSKGISNWATLVRNIQELPYGRNQSRIDFSLVIKENKGTCSSKHALLKQVADLNNIPNVDLVLAIYKMNDKNTPGIDLSKVTRELAYIPEAHCYLKVNNESLDITTPNSSITRIENDIISETIIKPEQVGQYKIDYHQKFILDWITQNEIKLSFDQVWQFREQCIANLSKNGST